MAACGNDQAANLRKGEEYCRLAKVMGADIALFPEMWNIGYTWEQPQHAGAPVDRSVEACSDDLWRAPDRWTHGEAAPGEGMGAAIRAWRARAVPRDGAWVGRFRELARELRMAVAITYLEEWDGPPRNSVSLIDRHGEFALTYAKVHTCDFGLPEMATTPGDGFYACDLDTEGGIVRVGAMICYDREFPESARVLMLEGAEVILTPNACDLEANRLGQFRARAYENMVGAAMANYAGPRLGHSVAYDACAFDRSGRTRDTLLVEAGEVEGVYLAPFDMDEIRAYRGRETWANAFRRPHRYGQLTSPEVRAPFVRVDAEGEAYDRTRR